MKGCKNEKLHKWKIAKFGKTAEIENRKRVQTNYAQHTGPLMDSSTGGSSAELLIADSCRQHFVAAATRLQPCMRRSI